MNTKVTVDINRPSFYVEPDTAFHQYKRKIISKPVLKIINKYITKKDSISILEIGTGSGYIISYLESKYPSSKLYGIEYDDRLVELSRKKVKFAKIIQGNAEDFNFGDIKFDFILSMQVIEHLYNPELMIETIKKHLKSNGIFMFTTPNLEGVGARIMRDKWHAYRDDHVSLKSFTDWKLLIESYRFKPLYCGSTFFSGIPILNKFPLGILNWVLLFSIGSLKWKLGESFIGVFRLNNK